MANMTKAAVKLDQTAILSSDQLHNLLCKRFNRAKGIADQWASILEACYFYAVPWRNRFYQPIESQGDMKNSRLYDTTAVEGVKTFVSKLQVAMTPPQTQWAYLQVDESDEDGDQEAINQLQMTLDDYVRKVFMYIHRSNFDVVINECYFDLAVGTASLVINMGSDKNPLMCTSIAIDKLSIEEAANSKIESWYRTWDDLKISELQMRWKNLQLTPLMIAEMFADPDARVQKIYEGVSYFPGKEKPYLYAVWTSDTMLMQEELKVNPGIIWRFQKINNETWGRGPVMDALPTIISANEMARIEFASANLNTFKPYMGFSDAIFNPHTFKLEPFTIIPIAPIGQNGQAPLIPLPDSSNPQFSQVMLADLRAQIRALLFAESATESPGVQPQTAFEVATKQQSIAEKVGPLFSRLEVECIEPIFNRCAYILDKMGLVPYPETNGQRIKFVYKSPLALAKGQQDIARLTQYMQLMQGLFGAEGTQLYINPQTTPYLMAEAMQVDPRYLNAPDQVAQVMQQQLDQKQDAMMQPQDTTQPETGNPALDVFQ